MSDDLRNPSNRPAASLLDELESIKGTLADGAQAPELPNNIPLLDDMVIDHLDSNSALLEIDQIFNEDIAAASVQFPRLTLDVAVSDNPASSKPVVAAKAQAIRPDYSREVLIQKLVDEFIPQIESALHDRLNQLDDAALQRLLKNSK